MENEKQPDSTPGSPKVDASKANEVKNNEPQVPDYEAILREKDERIAKLASDRDNYRTGMLKYKKSRPDDELDESNEDKMRQIIREELLNTDLAKTQAEKEAIIQKMAKELKEAKTAISNKSQMPTIPGGSSQPQDEITIEKISDQQKADLTERAKQAGVDPKKFVDSFLKNLEKNKVK